MRDEVTDTDRLVSALEGIAEALHAQAEISRAHVERVSKVFDQQDADRAKRDEAQKRYEAERAAADERDREGLRINAELLETCKRIEAARASEWAVALAEREACAKAIEALSPRAAEAIRARPVPSSVTVQGEVKS